MGENVKIILTNSIKFASLILAVAIAAAFPLAAPVSAAPGRLDLTGYVNTPRLNIRSGPYFTYSVIVIADQGQGFNLLGRNTPASWVQIKLPSGIVGWAKAAYIKTSASIASLPVTGDADAAALSTGSAIVATGRLNVRSGPDPFSQVLTIVDKGTSLTLIGRNTSGTWAQVKTPNGTQGWVRAAFLRPNIRISALPVTGP